MAPNGEAATVRGEGRWGPALRRPGNWLQLVKFGVVGASGYAVNLAVYSALVLGLDVHYLAAAVCSFLVAVTNNYTWNRLWTFRNQRGHLVYQGFRYEGLTVNFLELLYSAGGTVLSEDGQSVEVDSPEAEKALSFMVEGFQNGATPKAVTTYKEEEARRAFESGKATFMRNWPYAYALGKESKIADKFEIGTFPSFEGGEPASVLGGFNLAISAFAKNPEGAAAFIDFATSEEVQKANFLDSASPPAFAAVYDDPEVQEKYAFAADLKKAVEQGQARPVSPVYPQISEAIFNNVHDALQGKVEPKAALKTMSGDIEKALETF